MKDLLLRLVLPALVLGGLMGVAIWLAWDDGRRQAPQPANDGLAALCVYIGDRRLGTITHGATTLTFDDGRVQHVFALAGFATAGELFDEVARTTDFRCRLEMVWPR